MSTDNTSVKCDGMSFSNCTALHYCVTLHLLADCNGQLDGTGRPAGHTEWRWLCTLVLVEHFMLTLDCDYEHYKQWTAAKLHRPVCNTSGGWGQCCQKKSTSHTWMICHCGVLGAAVLCCTTTWCIHTMCSAACLVVVISGARTLFPRQASISTATYQCICRRPWHWHEAASALSF